jgi:hypothetical protein
MANQSQTGVAAPISACTRPILVQVARVRELHQNALRLMNAHEVVGLVFCPSLKSWSAEMIRLTPTNGRPSGDSANWWPQAPLTVPSVYRFPVYIHSLCTAYTYLFRIELHGEAATKRGHAHILGA